MHTLGKENHRKTTHTPINAKLRLTGAISPQGPFRYHAPNAPAEPVTTPSTPSPEARPTAAPVGEEEPEVPATPPPTPEDTGGSEDADHVRLGCGLP